MKKQEIMKNLMTIMMLALFAAVICASCDRIEGPYFTVPQHTEYDTTLFDDLPVDPATVYRKILIEEYTGHRCSNCPRGHQELERLHGVFGDTLVAVGVHYTSLANPKPNNGFPYDFRTEIGNALGSAYNINSIPFAVIDRNGENGTEAIVQWEKLIKEADRKVYAAVQLVNQLSDELKTTAKITMLEDYPYPMQLSLLLIEDNIVQPQLNGSDTVPDYVHNHVLRTGINGTWGVLLTDDGILKKGHAYYKAAKVSFEGTDWNVDNCYVVAILYDKQNRKVLQVEKVKVR